MRDQAANPLTQLYFHLTTGQNLAHRMCISQPVPLSNSPGENQHAYLDLLIFQKSIDEALPLGLASVKLTGGEPFSHPQIEAILDNLEKHALKVMIETNGAGITPGLVEQLVRIARRGDDVCQVAIGLKGADASSHDGLSGIPESYDAAVNSARLLVSAGLSPSIVFTLVRHNSGQVLQMLDLAHELGAASVRFNPLIPQIPQNLKPAPPGENGHNEVLRVEELIALGRRFEREIAPISPLRLIFDQPPAFRGLNPSGRVEGFEKCAVLEVLSILPDGSITLCGGGNNSANLILGQMGKDTLRKIWMEHPMLTDLRENLPNQLEGICRNCSLRSSCLGHCVVQNYIQKGSFWGPYWFCEDAERVGLFPASRLEDS